MNCDSTSDKVYFTEGDVINCLFFANLSEGFNYLEGETRSYVSTNFRKELNISDYGHENIINNSYSIYLDKLTLDKDINQIKVRVDYSKDSEIDTRYKELSFYISALPREEIERKQFNRLNILILFISASILSVLAGMRYLQEIIKSEK